MTGSRLRALRGLLLRLALAVGCLACPALAHAFACSSTGGNWGTAGTWTGCNGTIPQAGDSVTITAGTVTVNTTTIPATGNLASLAISGGTMTWGNNATARTINVSGDVTMSGTGAVNVSANNAIHTFNVGGNIVLNSSNGFDLFNTAARAATLNLTNAAGATISGTGSGASDLSTVVTTGGLTINKSGAAVTQTGTLTVGSTTSHNLTITAGQLSLGNSVDVFGATNVTGTLFHTNTTGTRNFRGTVTVSGAGVWNNAANESPNFGDGLVFNGTTFTAGTGTYTFDAALGQASQDIGGSSALAIPTVSVATGTTLTNTNTNAVTGLTVSTALGGAGAFANGAGSLLNLGFATVGVTTFTANATGNTVNYSRANTQTVRAVQYWNLILSNTSAKTMTSVTSILGDLTISGSATMTGNAAFDVDGTFNYNSSGSTTLAAGINITVGKFSQTAGTLNDNGRTITVDGTGAGTWSKTGGTFTASGTVIFTGAAPQIGASNFANLTINVGSGNTATLTGTANPLTGNLSVSSGTFDLSTFTANRSAAGGTLTVSNGATLKIGGTNGFPTNYTTISLGTTLPTCSTVEYAGTAQTVASQNYGFLTLSGSGTKTMPGSALSVACDFTMQGTAAATAASAMTVGRDFIVSSGTSFTAGNFTHNVARNFTNNGATFTPSTSTFNFNGGVAQAIGGSAAGTTFNNLTTSTASTAVTVSDTMPLVMNGTLTLGASTSFNAGTASHQVKGNFTNSTGNAANFVPSTGTFTFNGAGAQAISGTNTTFFNLATATASTAVTVSNALTIGGALTLGSGTTFNAGASTGHSIAGNFTNNGATFSSTGTFTFNGSSLQTIGGSAATTFNNLTISNASNVTLGANAAATNTLTFSSGLVLTGANVLTVGSSGVSGTITGAGSSNFVAGNLARGVPTGNPTVAWPVGVASPSTVYAPASLTFNTVGTGGLVQVSTANGDHASISGALLDSTKSVNRTWTLANTSTVYTDFSPTFTFVAGDVDGGANTANFLVGKYFSSSWSYPDVGTRTATSTAASAIPSGDGMGDFQLAESGTVTAFSEYRFEQTSWNGTSNEVIDNGSGAKHGTAAGLSGTFPSTANTSPALAGDPGSCRYGVFDRTNKQYIALPASYPALGSTSSFTITGWIRTTNNTLGAQRVMIQDENNSAGGWGVSLGEGGTGTLRFYSRGTPSALTLDTANVISNNNWFFFAAVADITLKRKRVYVWNAAGTLVANVTSVWTEANFGTATGITSIGGETNPPTNTGENDSNFGFAGNIDYVRVHQVALGKEQINTLRLATHTCNNVNHYAISFPGGSTAVTCDPAQVTVTAHDAAHASVAPSAGTVLSLNTDIGTGVWTVKDAGTGTFTPSGLNNGAASYTWPGGETSVTLRLRHNTTTTLSVNLADSNSKSETGTEDPNLTYAGSALRISNGSNGALSIGTQIAGKPSNTGFGTQSLYLQGIRTDTNTGACTSLFPNGGEVDVQVGGICTNPASCAQNVSLTTTASTSNTGTFVPGAAGSYPSTIKFKFSTANAEAPFNFSYADAGQIALQFRAAMPSPPASTFVSGASGNFIVRPYGLRISGVTTSASPAATDTVFATAGSNFSTTVTAVQWQAGNDVNNDGAPDSDTEIASNAATPNFGQESAPGPAGATVSHTLNAPSGGAAGTLGGASFTGFASGTKTGNMTWSEVGFINLFATSTDYLGSGQNVTNSASGLTGVGRFKPDHFTVTTAGSLAAACSSGAAFTYLGQSFGVSGVIVQARNSGDVLTQNYTGAYARHTPATVSTWGLAARDTAGAGTTLSLDTATAAVSGSWSNGSLTAGFSSMAITRSASAPAGPYASAKLGIALTDLDSVAVGTGTLDLDADGVGGNDHKQIGGTGLFRYGRLRLQGATGASRQHGAAPWLELSLPARVEYWNGTTFALNTDDSCTTLDRANVALGSYKAPLAACQTMLDRAGTGTVTFSSGAATLKLSNPGSGNEGSVLVTPQLGASASGNACNAIGGAGPAATAATKSYLQGAWTGANYDQNPSARAAFGVYGAQPRNYIFFRENY